MPQLIAGNWKMHCLAAEAIALARDVAAGAQGIAAELVVCPTALHVAAVAQALQGSSVAVGGQDCHQARQGAHTGDIAAPMLRDVGASWVILGHSERRQNHGETDELVREKTLAAVAAGLTPIVCVGEQLNVREDARHIEHVLDSLTGSLAGVAAENIEEPAGSLVIAYEPVWAIGTGKTATSDDAQEMCAALRARLAELVSPGAAERTRILYGGSVKASNAAELMAEPDVDGALVGGASLIAEDFCGIVRAALPKVEASGSRR